MTMEEKIGQVGCVWITSILGASGFDEVRARRVIGHGIGEVTRIAGATALLPGEVATLANSIQRFLVEQTRLGIPAIVHEEGTGGFSARGATVFPQALGLAATFDPALVREVAGVVRDQMRAAGARQCLAPVLDVARDPRWGRVEETYGEDPFLVSTMGSAFVSGLQTADVSDGVLATGKHFVGHSLPEGGKNHAPVQVGARELRDVYAEPFAAAIREAGLASVMNSYSSVDGLACAGSGSILTKLLREELHFDGIVVADYFAIALLVTHHRVAADKADAAVRALEAGLDIELPETDCFGAPLVGALAAGKVSQEALDDAVLRVLTTKFRLGLFEQPYVDSERASAVFDTAVQRELALRAATESVVLLANDGVLPLAPETRRVAVIGPGADDVRLLQGDYHYPAHQEIIFDTDGEATGEGAQSEGEGAMTDSFAQAAGTAFLPGSAGSFQPGPFYTSHVTPFAGLVEALGASAEVRCAHGCAVTGSDVSGIDEAVRLAEWADVAVVVVAGRSGLRPSATVGEARDATDLALTGVQVELVERVAATGTPVVTVVQSGRVHSLADVAARSNALLQVFPPGEEGGRALASVLVGASEPSGRLPVSIPRTVGQVPVYAGPRAGGSAAMFYGDYTDSPTSPLFPFGHGLSYTTVEYGPLEVHASDTSSPVTCSVEVVNVGSRKGVEVVQLYVTDLVGSVARPERQLVGFVRADLGVGESRRVNFVVDASRLGFFDESLRRVTEPGAFRFAVGRSYADLRSEVTVEIEGETVEHPIHLVVATTSTVGDSMAARPHAAAAR
jgi:beta-glucosidase